MALAGNTLPGTRKPIQKNDIRDVVFLHGWGSNAAVWKDIVSRLAPRCRVHAPDLPGYGCAPLCAPHTLDGLADALARAAPGRCHVVGWSLGGQVALAWATRKPRQVAGVALIAATPCFAQRADWPHGVAPEVLAGFSSALAVDRPGTLKRFASLQAQDDDKAKQVARRLRAALAVNGMPGAKTLEGGLRILLGTDLRDDLGAINQPALVIHGDRDRVAPLAAGEHLSSGLPNARLHVLHGVAHVPFLSRPGEVAAALGEFFDG